MPGTFDDVVLKFATDASGAVEGIEILRKTLSKFANATKRLESANYNLSGLNKQLRTLSKVATSLSTIATPINEGLSAIDKIASNNSLNTLATQLHNLDFKQLKIDTNNLVKTLKPLASQFKTLASNATKVQNVMSKLPSKTNKVTKSVKKLNEEANKKDGYFNLAAKATSLIYMIKRLSDVMAGFIEKSVSYTETINLFGVAMNDQVVKANAYANSLAEAFDIDTSTVMKYMGVFQELNTSMGMTSDMAYTMSASFAQLGIDIASLWNLPIETVYEKLESGLTGITRPLKQIGIDVTENALTLTAQMEAQKALEAGNYELAESLSASIEGWSRVQKQQMIYLTILRQTTSEQGDFARTINSPANQLKIFYEQLAIMQRNVGNIFYESIAEILPYLNAMMMLLNDSLESLASFVGYVAPSAIAASNAAEDTSNAFDSVGNSADEAKESVNSLVSGLDKFTTLSKGKKDNSSLYAAFDIEMPDYSSTLKDVNSKAKDIYESMKKIQPVIEGVAISLGLLTASTIISKIGKLGASLTALSGTASLLNAQTVAIVALIGVVYALIKLWNETDSTLGRVLIIVGGVTAAFIALAVVTKGNLMGSLVTLKATFVELGQDIIRYVYVAVSDLLISLKKLAVSMGDIIVKAAKKMIAAISSIKLTTLALVGSIAILAAGIGLLIGNWGKMGEWQRVITIFSAITAAVAAAAIAFGIFHATATAGIAAAATAAGVALIVGSVIAGLDSVPKFADGGIPTKGNLFIANEAGPELVGNIGGENAVANNDMIVAAIQEPAYLGFKKAIAEENASKKNEPIPVELSIGGISDSKIARALAPALKLEYRRGGGKI